MSDKILFVAPNMYVLRNWLATGLADHCQNILKHTPVFLTHFSDSSYKSHNGLELVNYFLPTAEYNKMDDCFRLYKALGK